MRKTLSLLLLTALLAQTVASVKAQSGAAKSVQESPASAAAPLRNQDVLEMLKSGLSPEVVIAKINISTCEFDTSPAALQQLKAANVPDTVLLAMLKPAGREPTKTEVGATRPPLSVEVKLPNGTPIEVESAHKISSADVQRGSALSFRVVSPVKVDGVTVVAVGALATGRVMKAKKGGYWGRAGKLIWTMESVESVEGRLIPLQVTNSGQSGTGRGSEVATKTVVTGILLAPLFPIAPLALMNGFKRGDNAVLPEGKRYTVFVRGDTTIKAIANQ